MNGARNLLHMQGWSKGDKKMKETQLFNFKGQQVRTVTIDGELTSLVRT